MMKKGDIYFLNIKDFEGSEQGGFRPVIVLKDSFKDVLVALMTKKQKTTLPVHINIEKKYTGLKNDSVILLEQIRMIEKKSFISKKPITRLKDNRKWNEIDKGLKISLDL